MVSEKKEMLQFLRDKCRVLLVDKIKWPQIKDEIKNTPTAAVRKPTGCLQQMTSSIYTDQLWQKTPKQQNQT